MERSFLCANSTFSGKKSELVKERKRKGEKRKEANRKEGKRRRGMEVKWGRERKRTGRGGRQTNKKRGKEKESEDGGAKKRNPTWAVEKPTR